MNTLSVANAIANPAPRFFGYPVGRRELTKGLWPFASLAMVWLFVTITSTNLSVVTQINALGPIGDDRCAQTVAMRPFGTVAPRFGQSNEVGFAGNYDGASDVLSSLVVASIWITTLVVCCRLEEARNNACPSEKMDDCSKCCLVGQRFVEAFTLVLALPAHVHLVGIWIINHIGGLTGIL